MALSEFHPTVIKIRALAHNGLNQVEIAKQTDVPRRTVCYWLNHKREVSRQSDKFAIAVSPVNYAVMNQIKIDSRFHSMDEVVSHLLEIRSSARNPE